MEQDQDDNFWNLVAKKLAGEATPEEQKALEQQLRKNPELHYSLQTITGLWEHTAPDAPATAEAAFDRHLDRMKDQGIEFRDPAGYGSGIAPSSSRIRTGRILALASTLAILTLIGLFIFRSTLNNTAGTTVAANTINEVTTHNGSRTNLYLPDGTRVWLNAGSNITYDKNFGATDREVTLSGEAFFDVTPNPARPFLIHAEHIDIKVLGTSFNVKSYPTDKTTEAILIRGSIEVALKDKTHEKIILKPNEKLIVANNEDSIRQQHPAVLAGKPSATEESHVTIRKPTYERNTGAIVETSWVNDKLIFQAEKFSDLALKMERWYGVSIHFADPGIEDMRLTGTFTDETITEALDDLKITAPFHYSINENQITIVK